MERRACRLRGLVHQFFHLQRPLRNLSGGPVRPSGAARQRHRQGAAGASGAAVPGQWLVAIAVVGAGLEHAVDRILQIARRGPDGRVDGVPGQRSGADGAGARDVMSDAMRNAPMEIVLLVAVADNGVIGSGGAIPWRLKTDQQRLKAMTMDKPVVMGRKTFLSLRRPLPGRTNIVVTRDPILNPTAAAKANPPSAVA